MVAQQTSLRRNAIALWTGLGVRVAVAFIFVPYVTGALGASRYGLWSVLFQIINYLAILDFGFEKAIINFVASFAGKSDIGAVNRVIASCSRLYLWFGTAAFALTLLFAWLLVPHLRANDAGLIHEGQISLALIGLFVGFRFWFTPITAALGGFQRYDLLTHIQIAEDIARTVVVIFLLKHGYGLVAMALCVLCFGLARQLITIFWLKHVFPQWSWRTRLDPEMTRDLFHYSRITFAITLCWMVIFNTDSLLLGLFASTVAAGVYAPATQFAASMRNLVNAIGTPLTAAVSHAQGARGIEHERNRYLKLFGYTSYAGFGSLAIVSTFADSFVHLWLPAGFNETSTAMVILAVGSAIFIPHILSNSMLFALNQHSLLLIVTLIEAALKLLLAFFLLAPFGSTGMALANAIPQVLLYTTLYPFLVGKAVNLAPTTLLWTQFRAAVYATLFTLPIAWVLRASVPPQNWPILLADVATVVVTGLTGFWFYLPRDKRPSLLNFLRQH